MFEVMSLNVENLFTRAKILNLRSSTAIDGKIACLEKLQDALGETIYTPAVKQEILDLVNGELKDYVSISEERDKLLNRAKTEVVADGVADWDGSVMLKRAKFSETARLSTAKVFRKINPDVACVVEAEDRATLRRFDGDLLGYRFKYEMLIDGNDPRGIDVGIYSKHPIVDIKTHVFDKDKPTSRSYIFGRDCPEIAVDIDGTVVWFLLNHFKSKGGTGSTATKNARRKLQANRVAEILDRLDLTADRVIVAGDFNDTPDSDALSPLTGLANLEDTLDRLADQNDRWTYDYRGQRDQIDFIMASAALMADFHDVRVFRRGMYFSDPAEQALHNMFPEITSSTDAASDHAAVVARFEL